LITNFFFVLKLKMRNLLKIWIYFYTLNMYPINAGPSDDNKWNIRRALSSGETSARRSLLN
jgi:hypothetical protein